VLPPAVVSVVRCVSCQLCERKREAVGDDEGRTLLVVVVSCVQGGAHRGDGVGDVAAGGCGLALDQFGWKGAGDGGCCKEHRGGEDGLEAHGS
jgi:hypothetical protein